MLSRKVPGTEYRTGTGDDGNRLTWMLQARVTWGMDGNAVTLAAGSLPAGRRGTLGGTARREHHVDDEPLERWAERRERRRPARGERRMAPLGDQMERGAHVGPRAPRGIQEWDGHQWVPVGIADDFTSAAQETGEDAAARAARVPLPSFDKLPPAPEPWRPTEVFRRPGTT